MPLPHADDYLNEPGQQVEEKVMSSYERQENLVEKELKKLTKDRPSVTVTMFEVPETQLVTDLEARGFVVKYKLNYDQGKPNRYFCKLKVIHPKLSTPASDVANDFLDNLEDNLKSFGFSTSDGDCNAFKEMVSNILKTM